MRARFTQAWGFFRPFWVAWVVMCGAYGMSVSSVLVARALTGDSIRIIGLTNNLLHLMILPSLLFLPLMGLARRWIQSAWLVLPFIVTLSHYSPLFWKTTPPLPDGQPFSIMTYNVLSTVSPFDDRITLIADANADVVAVQELGLAMAGQMERDFSEAYPYQALHPNRVEVVGQGILSRYPILESTFWQTQGIPALGHQRVRLDVHGREVVVYNLHAVHPGMIELTVEARNQEIKSLLERALVDRANYPVLMVGDFNMTQFTTPYQQITQHFTDAWHEVGYGLGFTFPNLNGRLSLPILRLDHVFYSDEWSAQHAQVLPPSDGSDHYPLWVQLTLEQNK